MFTMNFLKCVAAVGALAVVLSAGFGTSSALADVLIYQDTFARGSTETPLTLNGTQVNVDAGFTGTGLYGGSTTATWLAGTTLQTNGTEAGDAGNAYLPFTPQADLVYTYSLDLNATGAAGDQWAAFGFASVSDWETLPPGAWHEINSPGPWMLMYEVRATDNYIAKGPGAAGLEAIDKSHAGYNSISWVLDTTGTDWTAQFYRGTTATGSQIVYSGGATTINAIGFGQSGGTYLADNLSLTVIPEPSSLVLVGVGLVGLLAYAWRRRKCVPSQS